MFYWIYDMPTWTMVFMVCAFFVGVTWIGRIFIGPFLRMFVRGQPDLNNLVGYLLGAHGVYFGILLGLLALAAYQNYADVEQLVADESNKIASLYRDCVAYPQPIRDELASQVRVYTRYVIDEAWPLQKQGIVPTKGTILISRLQETLTAFEPKTKGQEILHAETLRVFDSFVEARRERLQAVTTGIPAVLWYVVFIGAGVQIALLWLLDVKLIPHMVLSGMISFYLGTLIALIAAMDNPFRGEVSVSPEAYELVYESVIKPAAPAPDYSPPKVP